VGAAGASPDPHPCTTSTTKNETQKIAKNAATLFGTHEHAVVLKGHDFSRAEKPVKSIGASAPEGRCEPCPEFSLYEEAREVIRDLAPE
jgi:hypothetical protein